MRFDVLPIEGTIAIEEVLENLQLGSGSVKTAHFGCLGFCLWVIVRVGGVSRCFAVVSYSTIRATSR